MFDEIDVKISLDDDGFFVTIEPTIGAPYHEYWPVLILSDQE